MSVRWRDDRQTWVVDLKGRWGRRRRALDGTLARRSVEALERQWRLELEAGRDPFAKAAPRPTLATLGELLARYWSEHARRLTWAPTVRGHLSAICDALGDATELSAITTGAWANAVSSWRDVLAPATINRRVAVGSSAWTRARRLWSDEAPGLQPIDWPALALPTPETNPRDTMISPEDWRAILAAASPHVRLAAEIAMATGWRRASVLGMRWEHVNWTARLVVGRGKSRRPGGKVIGAALTTELERILLDACRGEPPLSGPVVAYRGQPVADIKVGWRRACRRAGVEGVKFKDVRSTVACEVLDSGGDVTDAQAVLDHEDPRLTHRHYARASIGRKQLAMERRARLRLVG